MKNPTGLTSVTFRHLSVRQIIDLTCQAGGQGIEWGSDVHVKPEDLDHARMTGQLCRQAGLEVFSYGSYYKLNQGLNPQVEFRQLTQAALALGAPLIRIWAGRTPSAQVSEAQMEQAVRETLQCCEIAREAGLQVAFEYHRRSLTDCADSAVNLMNRVNHPALKLYWQPNPELSEQENREELKRIRPWLCRVHVFSWLPDNTRLPLREQQSRWQNWLSLIDSSVPLLLEFVMEDREEQFRQDLADLNRWLAEKTNAD